LNVPKSLLPNFNTDAVLPTLAVVLDAVAAISWVTIGLPNILRKILPVCLNFFGKNDSAATTAPLPPAATTFGSITLLVLDIAFGSMFLALLNKPTIPSRNIFLNLLRLTPIKLNNNSNGFFIKLVVTTASKDIVKNFVSVSNLPNAMVEATKTPPITNRFATNLLLNSFNSSTLPSDFNLKNVNVVLINQPPAKNKKASVNLPKIP
jgi:hypothetical protein